MMSGEGLNSTVPPSPRKTIFPHLRVGRMAVVRATLLAEQSTARSTPKPPVSSLTWSTLSEPEVKTASQWPRSWAICMRSGTTSMPMILFAAECAGGQSNRTEASDEHGVITVDADLLEALIDGAEAAGDLRAVGIGERIGQCDEIFLFRDHVLGHAAVTLPPIGAAILDASAGDHVAAAAIVAHSAAGDVVNDYAIARPEAAAALAGGHNQPSGFVSDDDALIAFRTFAKMLVIDAADIRAADGGGLDAQQNFSVAGCWHGHSAQFDGRVPGQVRRGHGVFHGFHLR